MAFKNLCLLGFCMAGTFAGTLAQAALPLGKVPPSITVERLDGKPWSSDELRGKVHLVVYSNVGERDLNKEAADAIKKEAFPREHFSSVAVINMKGSWQPDFAIEKALADKQKEFPDSLYVKDMSKVLVKQWNLEDKSNDFVLLDRDGTVLFSVDGQLKKEQIDSLISLIKTKIATPASKT